jgi:TRAP-type C4-dicarboxylate transport system permease small subunit
VHIAEQSPFKKRSRAGGRNLPPAADAVARFYDLFIDLLGIVSALILLALPVIIKWVLDVCEYLLFFSTFLGAPWLMRLGLHVRVDVLLTSLTGRLARRLEQALDFFCVGICGVLAYYGLLAALDAYRLGLKQYKAITVPDWPFHAIFVFTMVLLAIEFIRRLRRPEQALEHDPTVGM